MDFEQNNASSCHLEFIHCNNAQLYLEMNPDPNINHQKKKKVQVMNINNKYANHFVSITAFRYQYCYIHSICINSKIHYTLIYSKLRIHLLHPISPVSIIHSNQRIKQNMILFQKFITHNDTHHK